MKMTEEDWKEIARNWKAIQEKRQREEKERKREERGKELEEIIRKKREDARAAESFCNYCQGRKAIFVHGPGGQNAGGYWQPCPVCRGK